MEFLLFEHIRGYELFTLKEFEDLSSSSYNDYLALTQVVTHVSSLPFENPADALDHILVCESAVTTLKNFLSINGVKILHCDPSLNDILSSFGITCKYSPNITRGIRANIHKFLKITEKTDLESDEKNNSTFIHDNTTIEWIKQMILSTSHAFSREAIQYDMKREDNLVTSVAAELDALDDEITVFEARIRQMVEWIFPQFMKVCPKNKVESTIEWVVNYSKGANKPVEEENLSSKLLMEVLEEADEEELENLRQLNVLLSEKKKLFKELTEYLTEKMKTVAPNLRAILGDRLACKFIRQAGGLVSLSLSPASTIQLIGAEKSLFRSLKMRTPTPKYGIIHVLDTLKENQGRMARYIATKCALAARIDAFSEDRTSSYGEELKKLIDKKVRSYRGGPQAETTKNVLERVKERLERAKKQEAKRDNAMDMSRMKPKDVKTSKDMKTSKDVKSSKDVKTSKGEQIEKKSVQAKNNEDVRKRKAFYEPTESSKRKAFKRESSSKGNGNKK